MDFGPYAICVWPGQNTIFNKVQFSSVQDLLGGRNVAGKRKWTSGESQVNSIYNTPTKRSNAQHLVEYQKQLLYVENQKSENVIQQPMDSCVYHKRRNA